MLKLYAKYSIIHLNKIQETITKALYIAICMYSALLLYQGGIICGKKMSSIWKRRSKYQKVQGKMAIRRLGVCS